MKNIGISLLVLISLLKFDYGYGQNYFEQAYNEYFNGDINKSLALFTKSIENHQEIPKSYMYRGAAESFLNNFPDALIDLNRSLKLDSSNDKIYYYLGKYYLFQGLYSRAVQYYDISIRKNSKNAAAFDERAASQGGLGEFQNAIRDEDIAIKLDSTKEFFYTDRGFAKAGLKQYQEAIMDYNISIRMKPNHKAYADRGFCFCQLGAVFSKAIEDDSNALKILPQDYEIYYRRGLSYKAIGKMDEACKDFSKSVELGYSPAIAEQKSTCK